MVNAVTHNLVGNWIKVYGGNITFIIEFLIFTFVKLNYNYVANYLLCKLKHYVDYITYVLTYLSMN